jgi:hypothetical protein
MSVIEALSATLAASGRIEIKDMSFISNQHGLNFPNRQLIRVVGIQKNFYRVNFAACAFDSCYFRDCTFTECNFTGCRFVSSNFHGSTFVGCRFDYAYFEKTMIDRSILSTNCPSFDNLKERFARSLRVNYQQIGDTSGVNQAIRVELSSTKIYLFKSWRSNESYYRSKFSGWKRVVQFFRWLEFKILELIWGNGESVYRLIFTIGFLIFSVFLLDLYLLPQDLSISAVKEALFRSPHIFFGIQHPPHVTGRWLAVITAVRLLMFGFLTSVMLKKLNRR